MKKKNTKISNQYLLAVVSLLTRLGVNNVSSAVMVEAWCKAGNECDEIYFMHLDTLIEYKFVQYSNKERAFIDFEQLLSCKSENDELLTLTHEGIEFLNGFGGK